MPNFKFLRRATDLSLAALLTSTAIAQTAAKLQPYTAAPWENVLYGAAYYNEYMPADLQPGRLDKDIALMKQHGTWYVPTLSAGHWVREKAKTPGFFPDLIRPKAETVGAVMDATFKHAYESGLKIAFGTDTGVSAHGDNAQEFVFMVNDGMPPMKALQAATTEAAKLIGDEKEIGSVEAGKFADLVAVPGDLLADITLTELVRRIQETSDLSYQI